jgi:hypothetical protein
MEQITKVPVAIYLRVLPEDNHKSEAGSYERQQRSEQNRS